jgi:hypothetical protein
MAMDVQLTLFITFNIYSMLWMYGIFYIYMLSLSVKIV